MNAWLWQLLSGALALGMAHTSSAAPVPSASLANSGSPPSIIDSRSELIHTPCSFEHIVEDVHLRCGVLIVPENYRDERAVHIRIPFVVIEAMNRDASDAIPPQAPLLIAGGGGPGSPLGIGPDDDVGQHEVWKLWLISSVKAGRDLVLMDNRGVGSSTPRLDCPKVIDTVSDTLTQEASENRDARSVDAILAAFTDCRARLEAGGATLSHFHVVNAARDIEQFRLLSGHPSLDLYGASYGSRVVMMYQRLFPDTTRTLTLDSAFPFDRQGTAVDQALVDTAFERIFSLCETHAKCTTSLGADLRANVLQFLQRLEVQNAIVPILQPESTGMINLVVTPDVFIDAVFNAAYQASQLSGLPALLHTISRGDTDALHTLIEHFYYTPMIDRAFADAAHHTYLCHDAGAAIGEPASAPLAPSKTVSLPATTSTLATYRSAARDQFEERICAVLGVERQSTLPTTNTHHTPTLILAGSLDPVTPLGWSEALVHSADNRWLVTFGDVGHFVIGATSWCADAVMAEFLAAPTRRPDVPCAQNADERNLRPTGF